ncbi:SpaA isopeptide-forming pilin-related protein [Bifidobacterium tibiigranuli]|jgi:LPXTG-motif cell wall-anchored protein|uniref:SpaA isopeptide-forming pilin-related protein n=2 Tax=Bifidobacterium tibiigranuli TaxID=2172043 RepID=UPI0034C63F22
MRRPVQEGHRRSAFARFVFSILAAVAMLATGGIVAAVHAPAAQAAGTATIKVQGGGDRTGASTVGPIPDGTVFTAKSTSGSSMYTCIASNGTCNIYVPGEAAYDVSIWSTPTGWYANQTLSSGTAFSVTSYPYQFRTKSLGSGSTTTIPGTNASPGTNNANADNARPQQRFGNQLAASRIDPAASAKCGQNIALVLDQSGSMAGDKQTNLKSAANATIDALTGTPSKVAIYTFSDKTRSSLPDASTLTSASAADLKKFVNNLGTPSNGTNWDAGLYQVAASKTHYDMVIFLTDGAPTVWGPNGDGSGSSSYFQYAEQGIFSANAIKAKGTRMVAVGIGLDGGADNLRAVSGTVPNVDYYTQSSADFGNTLKQLASGSCASQLTITKQLQDANGTPITPTPTAANGITFTNTISAGSTIDGTVTTGTVNGVNGQAGAALSIPTGATPTVTVTEGSVPGYTFVSAQCSVNGANVATTVHGSTASFTGAAGATHACTFINKQVPQTGVLTITKAFDTTVPTGAGTQTANTTFSGTYSCALSGAPNAAGNWTVTGPGNATLTKTSGTDPTAIPIGSSCSAVETSPASGTGTGLPNGSVWGVPTMTGPVTVAASSPANIRVTNTVTTLPVATVTISKTVQDVNGANPQPAAGWSMNTTLATGNPTGVALSPAGAKTTAGANGVTAPWTITYPTASAAASVTVAETQQTGYQFVSGVCKVTPATGVVRNVTLTGVAGNTVSLINPGDNVACSFVNKQQPGSVSWSKTDAGGDLLGGAEWTLTPTNPAGTSVTVSDNTGQSGYSGLDTDPAAGKFTVGTLKWGKYTLQESKAPAGYVLSDTKYPFEITATGLTATINGGKPITNVQQTPPTLPLTGGMSTDAFLIGGSALVVVSAGVWLALRRRSQARMQG